MTSDAKIEANRRNAQKSTGPKTAEGKATSSRNALSHGLTAKQLILFDESEGEFAAFWAELRADYAPCDSVEAILVERIAIAHWRLRRVWRAEAASFNRDAESALHYRARSAMVRDLAEEIEKKPPGGKPVTRIEAMNLAEAGMRALSDEKIDEMARPDEDQPPLTLSDLAIWPQRLTDLSRYEATLERQLHRLTLDLDRVQQRRRQRIQEAEILKRVELEHEGRMLAMRRKIEAMEADPDFAKRTQIPDDHPMAGLTIPRLRAEAAKRSQMAPDSPLPHAQAPMPQRAEG